MAQSLPNIRCTIFQHLGPLCFTICIWEFCFYANFGPKTLQFITYWEFLHSSKHEWNTVTLWHHLGALYPLNCSYGFVLHCKTLNFIKSMLKLMSYRLCSWYFRMWCQLEGRNLRKYLEDRVFERKIQMLIIHTPAIMSFSWKLLANGQLKAHNENKMNS